MPRQPRIDLPGFLYHIIARGIERRSIFSDKQDYEEYIRRLADVLEQSGGKCFAWVLMPNHVHMLLQSGKEGIADMMRKLMTGYAMYFNKKHRRAGHLFQNRYKSTLCDGNEYLMALVRYIHLNPFKAKLVQSIDELTRYPWSGHGVLIGRKNVEWQDSENVLSLFGSTLGNARANYLSYIQDGSRETGDFEGGGLIRSISHGMGDLIRGKIPDHLKYDERILGDGNFISSIYSKMYETDDIRNQEKTETTLDEVVNKIAKKMGVKKNVVCSRNRTPQIVQARKLATYIGVQRLGKTNSEVGKTLNISQSGITKIMQREKHNFEKFEKKSIKELVGA